MKVESREYKLLVNHEPFADAAEAVKAVWDEVEEAAKTLPMVRTKGSSTTRRPAASSSLTPRTIRSAETDSCFASEPLTKRWSTPSSADLRTAISQRGLM